MTEEIVVRVVMSFFAGFLWGALVASIGLSGPITFLLIVIGCGVIGYVGSKVGD